MNMDIRAFWTEHKWCIIAAVVAFILGGMVSTSAQAQTCTPATGDGPVAQQKSAVKKLADTVVVSWTAPTELNDENCTPISDDPTYAVIRYNLYVSLDAPATSGLPPIEIPANQTSVTINVDSTTGVRPGSRLYYAISAENEYGASYLSNQEWVQVGGPPGRPDSSVQ